MKGEYETDRQWSDQHIPQIQRILEDVMRQRMRIVIAPSDFRVDTEQATDLVSGVIGPKAFAARLRRPGVFWARNFGSPTHWGLQFTIRSARDSGVETELAKIRKGFADWFLYGHIEEASIRHWVVLDLDVFRPFELDAGVRREIQDNGDGTHFVAYDILSFPQELILATSPTMAIALDRGVEAVPRLRPKYLDDLDERCRQQMVDAPDLQQLVRKHGGYSNIPGEAWAQWDRENVAWQARRRP